MSLCGPSQVIGGICPPLPSLYSIERKRYSLIRSSDVLTVCLHPFYEFLPCDCM